MKTPIFILIILTFFSCQSNQVNESSNLLPVCNNIVKFGDIEICLPEIFGMVESNNNKEIREYVSKFEFDVNQIIGFYITKSDLNNFGKGGIQKLDGFFKIYSPKKLKNQEINNANLDEMVDLMSSNFLDSKWDDITKKIDDLGTNLNIDVPIQLEQYQPNFSTRTIVTFTKISSETSEDFQIMALNLINIKNRLIWATYNQSYTGPETIQNVKRKNDYMISKLIASNLKN